jgi:ferredoxin-NADP reductase
MVEFETEVSDIIQRTYNIKSFRFKTTEDVDFKPGQFFFVTIKIGDARRTKHFSFSNSPTEKGYIEFTKKITDSEFSRTLDRLKIGDWAGLRLAYGSFVIEDGYKKIAFLSGGIGITPIRSIVKYVIDKRLDTDMVLIYANRSIKDIAFKSDFDTMQTEYPRLKVVHVVSQAEAEWPGRVGLISGQVIREEIPDFLERKFYICGPPAMVDAMRKIVQEELAVSKENIIIENFMGY